MSSSTEDHNIKLSCSSNIKLKMSENAWKPSTKDNKPKDETGGSNSKHEELLKRTRGILNKLTPDNFVRLSVKVKELPIENYFDLDGIIVLVFEKAVDVQGFSSTYAQLCQVLSTMTVKHEAGNKDPKEGKETCFRNLMIYHCQKEIEKDNSKNLKIVEMGKQLEECSNADEKHELKLLIDYEETRLRKRSVGNICFIGELYKLEMLTSPIMMRFIEVLLKKHDEESLECLCKLLTIIGKNLEASARSSPNALEDFNKRFHEMKIIIEDKKSATSSRVRFLLMDVLDLRKNNWVPRREDAKPKTKAEVHADIKKKKELQQQQLHMMFNNTSRRDGNQRKNNRNNRDNEDNRDNKDYRDRARQQPTSDTAEFRAVFNNWSQGSSGGSRGVAVKGQPIDDTSGTTVNRFAIFDDGPSPNKFYKGAPPSLLAPGGGSSYHCSNFDSKSMPGPSEKENALHEVKRFVHPEIIKDPDVAAKYAKVIIAEYMNAKDLKDARICITEKFPPCNMNMFIFEALNWSIDRSVEKRNLIGKLFHELVKFRIATLEHFKRGAKEILEMVDDFRFDIPAVDRNLGELFACLMVDGAFNVEDIYMVIQSAEDSTASIMAEVVLAASKLLGEAKIQELWSLSNLRWENLVPKEKEDEKSAESSPEEKVQKRKELIAEFLKRHNNNFMQQKVIGRNSQQGGRPQQKIIDIKLSSSSDIKLKMSENAWKPSTKDNKPKDETGGSNSKHEELLKRTRGILNKLTPNNFVRLSVKMKELPIENYYDLDQIIVLVFEKAIYEQAFSSTYAQLCQVLSTMTVKHEEGNKDAKEGKETRFRNLMINRCQKEFEKDNSKNLKIVEMGKQLEECSNAEEKHDLKLLIDYEETRLRKRSVGNIRFIGELYKFKMLTSPIMMRIIEGLLKKHDEESLECLCKLLTTIGKNLESSARSSPNALEDFNKRFQEMKIIIEDKKSATSSRVRFLLMDVVDLRKNNWVPASPDGSTLIIGEAFEGNLKEKADILKKCVGNKEDLEMKVILGIQQLSAENQHPPGFTEKCFNAQYDAEVLSDESFTEWEKK